MGRTHRLRVLLVTGLLATAAFWTVAGRVSAYGAADHPLAQVEVSANCNNASFALCAPPPAGVGTGGIWAWTEIDTGGTADFTAAECFHTIGGVGGSGGAGAGHFSGTASWVWSTGVPARAFAFGTDPHNRYYVVTYDPTTVFAYPVTQGHYSFHPAPGVTIQLQVAP